jgi:tripartite-type tricarboxylate transporter receptor subunit TctC
VIFGYVMLAPAGTPKPIVDALHEASTWAVMSPQVRDKLRAVDTVPIALSPAESAQWLRTAREKWSDVVTRMNVRVD